MDSKNESRELPPQVVPIGGKRYPPGHLDEWLRSSRQPGPPQKFSKTAAEMLHETREEAGRRVINLGIVLLRIC